MIKYEFILFLIKTYKPADQFVIKLDFNQDNAKT